MKFPKKILFALIVCSLALSMTACGETNTDPAPSTTPTESIASGDAGTAPVDDTAGEMSPEAQAVVTDYQAMLDRYNTSVDAINADENLVQIEAVTATITKVSTALDGLTERINNAKNFTEKDITDLQNIIKTNTTFIDAMDAMLLNYGGKTIVTINATVNNQTGADLYTLALSPSNSASWGANLLSEPLKAGESGTMAMAITSESIVWDILAADANGTALGFSGLDFSAVDANAGATITLGVTEDGTYVAAVQ